MRKRKKSIVLAAIAILAVLSFGIYWGNTAIEINEYEISSERIPESFSGFRITQISDLHNAEFGAGNRKLIDLISQTDPDVIVLTGDIIDSRVTDIQIALEFAVDVAEIAPVYYIPGNHEARVQEYSDFKRSLESIGITILENQSVIIAREEEHIALIGVKDPCFETDYLFGDSEEVLSSWLDSFQNGSGKYSIMLSHRPELFDTYVAAGMDLVLTGHAHGGQIRLPFLGGLAAPNQGFFPEYDAGMFSRGDTNMIVSRGVGNSMIPIRINNRPEIVVAELHHKSVKS